MLQLSVWSFVTLHKQRRGRVKSPGWCVALHKLKSYFASTVLNFLQRHWNPNCTSDFSQLSTRLVHMIHRSCVSRSSSVTQKWNCPKFGWKSSEFTLTKSTRDIGGDADEDRVMQHLECELFLSLASQPPSTGSVNILLPAICRAGISSRDWIQGRILTCFFESAPLVFLGDGYFL